MYPALISKPLTNKFINTLSLGCDTQAALPLCNNQLLLLFLLLSLLFGRPLLWLFEMSWCSSSEDIFSLGSLRVFLLAYSYMFVFERFELWTPRSSLFRWVILVERLFCSCHDFRISEISYLQLLSRCNWIIDKSRKKEQRTKMYAIIWLKANVWDYVDSIQFINTKLLQNWPLNIRVSYVFRYQWYLKVV